MPKPKPDHREQVEFKLGVKERQYLEDLGLRQTIVGAGNTASNLGTGIGSLISPFVSGGDAGLLMALVTAHCVDSKLDDTTDAQLLAFLDSVELYPQGATGPYPSSIAMDIHPLLLVRGWPVIFADPADFPGLPNRWAGDNSDPPRNHGLGRGDFASLQGLVWTESMKQQWYQNKRGGSFEGSLNQYIAYCLENLLDVIPWLRLIPATTDATYASTPPTVEEIRMRGLWDKYRMNAAQGTWQDNNHYVIVWNDTVETYQTSWVNLNPDDKLKMFQYCGGSKRKEIDSLGDLLAVINLNIPGVEGIGNLFSAGQDALTEAVTNVAGTQDYSDYSPSIITNRPRSLWPALAYPPNSIYKYELLHTIIESIKVAVPWYLGTKFAIAGVSAVRG